MYSNSLLSTPNVTSLSNLPLLRKDGSPVYMSLKFNKRGAIIVIKGEGIDTMVRVSDNDYWDRYDVAARVLWRYRNLRTAEDKKTISRAGQALLDRYNTKLLQKQVHIAYQP